jgi:hypothetical protein
MSMRGVTLTGCATHRALYPPPMSRKMVRFPSGPMKAQEYRLSMLMAGWLTAVTGVAHMPAWMYAMAGSIAVIATALRSRTVNELRDRRREELEGPYAA